jgi:hypothetical protein
MSTRSAIEQLERQWPSLLGKPKKGTLANERRSEEQCTL